MPPIIEVVLTPGRLTGTLREEEATLARALRTLEANLHATENVVVNVTGAARPPSMARVPQSPQGAWQVTLSAVGTGNTVELKVVTCEPEGACTSESMFTNTDEPEPAAYTLATKVLAAMDIEVSETPLPCMSEVPSRGQVPCVGRGPWCGGALWPGGAESGGRPRCGPA